MNITTYIKKKLTYEGTGLDTAFKGDRLSDNSEEALTGLLVIGGWIASLFFSIILLSPIAGILLWIFIITPICITLLGL